MAEAVSSEPAQAIDLLDAVPILQHINVTEAPERIQRKLYDALQLTIRYHRPDQAQFRLVLTEDTVEALATSTGSVTAAAAPRAHADRTPPGTRTCALRTCAALFGVRAPGGALTTSQTSSPGFGASAPDPGSFAL